MCGFTRRNCWGVAAGFTVMAQAVASAFGGALTYLDAQQNFSVNASAQTTTTDNEQNSVQFNDLTAFNKTVSITAAEPVPGGGQATSTFASTVTSDFLPQTIQAFTGVNESAAFQRESGSAGGSGNASFSTDFTVDNPTDFVLNASFMVAPADPAAVIQDQVNFTLKTGSTVIATDTVNQDSFFEPSPVSFRGVLLPGSTYDLSVETTGNFAEASGAANIGVTMKAVPLPPAIWTCPATLAGIIGIGMILKRRRIALV